MTPEHNDEYKATLRTAELQAQKTNQIYCVFFYRDVWDYCSYTVYNSLYTSNPHFAHTRYVLPGGEVCVIADD